MTAVVAFVACALVALIFTVPLWVVGLIVLAAAADLYLALTVNDVDDPPLRRHRRDTYTESGRR